MSSTIWGKRCKFFPSACCRHNTKSYLSNGISARGWTNTAKYMVSWWFTFTKEAWRTQRKGCPTPALGDPEACLSSATRNNFREASFDKYLKWSWLYVLTEHRSFIELKQPWETSSYEPLKNWASIFPVDPFQSNSLYTNVFTDQRGWLLSKATRNIPPCRTC